MHRICLISCLVMMGLAVIASPIKSGIGARETSSINGEAKLPYDALVQYISINSSSSIKPCINTKINFIEADGTLNNLKVSYRSTDFGAWGYYTSSFGNMPWVGMYPDDPYRTVFFGYYAVRTGYTKVNEWRDYLFDSASGWYINGILRFESSFQASPQRPELLYGKPIIFGWSKDLNYGTIRSVSFSFSYLAIVVNGELVREMYPCRIINEDGNREGALYDIISGEIFRNAGTGSFEIGPDL